MTTTQFTFNLSTPGISSNILGHQSVQNVICNYCEKMVQQSKIIHQPPKYSHTASVAVVDHKPLATTPKFEVFEHHKTLGGLKASAKQCHLCALLSAYDPACPDLFDDSRNERSYNMKVLRADMYADGPGLLKVDVKIGKQTGVTYLAHGRPRDRVQKTLSCARTDHYEVLSLAKQWLNTCLTTHDVCLRRSQPISSWHLPTRVVHLTGFRTSITSMKLCLGKDLPASTQYLTLSHCWGGAAILKLTEERLQSFLSSIPVKELPQNFIDAAAVTLSLGYEYLWIDSLCIIQDSVGGRDWKQEAAVMGNVYRYAACTIATLAATSPHDRSLVDRDARSFLPCQLMPDSEGEQGLWAENWQKKAGKEVLNTRGWVVQESALSPRTLTLGTRMISWSCTVAEASELDSTMSTYSSQRIIKRQFYELLDKSDQNGQKGWRTNWWSIVGTFTSCDLSFYSDRWHAIQGLASLVELQTGAKLVHGLWEAYLAEELMWRVGKPKDSKRIENNVPSWSWLSLTGAVSRIGFNLDGYFRMDAAIALQDTPLDASKIFMRGRMSRIERTVKYHGDGTIEYCYRYVTPVEGYKPRFGWDGHWSPDIIPSDEWELWTFEFVTDDSFEAMGLVLRLENSPQGEVWSRAGSYKIYLPFGDDDKVRDYRWNLPKIRTITLT